MYQLGGTYKLLCEREGVEIRLNTRVTREYAEKEAPDAVIVAAGSDPVIPPIPGLREAKNMILAENYHLEKEKVGDSVVILGGGLVGCELAVCLADLGKKVKIVEMRSELCPDANIRYRPLLMKKMDEVGIEIHTDCTCKEVRKEGVVCSENGSEIVLKGDTVVAALGLKANKNVVEELRGVAPQFASIGNCVRPDTITFAVYQGYHAALDIH